MFEPIIERVTQIVIEQWLKAYRKSRVYTLVFTVLAVIVTGGIVAGVVVSVNRANEARRQANATYIKQIETLNTTEANLRNLIEFVESEKRRLSDSEKVLNNLRNEERLLKPVVESDRKTVESILELQNQKAQQNVSRERWIGFSLGVLASLIASVLFSAARFFVDKRRVNSSGIANTP